MSVALRNNGAEPPVATPETQDASPETQDAFLWAARISDICAEMNSVADGTALFLTAKVGRDVTT